ncbi:MAG: class I SAM-dependent methyltransferase [Gammaproteobacteria bacterium]|nr:class I SAM-dependent methyltransferase [Gammaproteobacteria bacterium]
MDPSAFAPPPPVPESAAATGGNWLDGPLGQRLLACEQALVAEVLERAFGEELVQIGVWGDARGFLELARTHRAHLVDARPGPGVGAVGAFDALPLATHSVDVLLLPHTLEHAPSPHALLREVDRVLRPDGQVLILGLSRLSAFGLRRLVSRSQFPSGLERFVSEHRVRDWLQLLDCEVRVQRRYLFGWPMQRGPGPERQLAVDAFCRRWLPGGLGCGYLLAAHKRTARIAMLPARWRRGLRVVGGLAEPTTRNCA